MARCCEIYAAKSLNGASSMGPATKSRLFEGPEIFGPLNGTSDSDGGGRLNGGGNARSFGIYVDL